MSMSVCLSVCLSACLPACLPAGFSFGYLVRTMATLEKRTSQRKLKLVDDGSIVAQVFCTFEPEIKIR